MPEPIEIAVPKPQMTEYSAINFATEVAFNSLVASAGKHVDLNPVMGLMYLPDQDLTRQFQEACRAVIAALKK